MAPGTLDRLNDKGQKMQENEDIYKSRLIAERIVSRDMEAYDAALMIWKQILDNLDRIPDELWPFKSCVSAIEDYIWNVQDSGSIHDAEIANEKREIIQAAIRLVKSNSA